MKIVYLSQYFPPEMGAPAARVSELAVRWVEAGHEVVVVTGFPNHPTGVVPEAYRGRWSAKETYRGVDVVRTFVYATPNKGILKRGLSYLSFAASSVLQGSLAREVKDADVVVATSPQFLCALSGFLLATRLGTPFVLEVRDLWPQSIVDLGVMGGRHPVITALRHLEQFVYRRASMLVSVTDAFVRTWAAQGVDVSKAVVVKNGVDLQRFTDRPAEAHVRDTYGLGDAFVVTYVGTHGLAHGLERLLEAAARLRHRDDIRFLFVGEGADRSRLIALAKARGLTNVVFAGGQPRDAVPGILAASDLVAVTLRNIPLFEQVIPSKIFEILACARPVLLAVRGEAAEIVERSGGGWLVEPEDVDGMVEAIEDAAARPEEVRARGAAGRAFVEREFDRDALAADYLQHLADVA